MKTHSGHNVVPRYKILLKKSQECLLLRKAGLKVRLADLPNHLDVKGQCFYPLLCCALIPQKA